VQRAPQLPAPGEVVGGKYTIERQLGEGGMGVVFEAIHGRLGQRVAIKMLLPALLEQPELVTRFEREARAAAQLRHRNTARVVDVDVTASGVPFMVMELLHGHDLDSELETRGPLPIGEAIHWIVQACSAMTEAHRLGIIHRDLKPSNLFLASEPDGSVAVKVLDFGISKIQTDDVKVTSTNAQMGTPLYMSPEQVRSAKNVDHRTDVWSLGVILFELIAGKPPYQGSAAGIGAAIVNDPPPKLHDLRPDVPLEVERAIERALAKDPAARFASTEELAAALAPFSSVPTSTDSIPRAVVSKLPSSRASASIVNAETLAVSVPEKNTGGSWSVKEPPPKRSRVALVVGAAVAVVGAAVIGIAFVRPALLGSAATASTSSAPPTPSTTEAPAASSAPASTSAAPTASAPPSVVPLATTVPSARSTGAPTGASTRSNPPPHGSSATTAHPTATSTKPDNPARL
jgi:serine/threonine-protein kinase